MKYVAFLRGINVGGKGIISMSVLESAFEDYGFENVKTYINSGNVIFESQLESKKLSGLIEKLILEKFKYESRVVIKSQDQLKRIISQIPKEWKNNQDLRKYIALTIDPITPKEVLNEINLKEGIDSTKEGEGVLFMTTLMSGLTKSGFSKLAGEKLYKFITIRNYNTIQKLFYILTS